MSETNSLQDSAEKGSGYSPPSGKTAGGRIVSVNMADPGPMLLTEAFGHLQDGCWLRFLTRRWPLTVTAFIFLVSALFDAWVAASVACGTASAILLCLILYSTWYSHFVSHNTRAGTLCPACTSRMWQLCCARCATPVPPLALMLGGVLLRNCPHCNCMLSVRRKTLLAWCSVCGYKKSNPSAFYARDMKVTAWIDDTLPLPNTVQCEEMFRSENNVVLYDEPDRKSAVLMIIRNDYKTSQMPLESHLVRRARLLLISQSIPEVWADRIRGFFGPRTLVQIVPPIREI